MNFRKRVLHYARLYNNQFSIFAKFFCAAEGTFVCLFLSNLDCPAIYVLCSIMH